jgi:tocopherol O-methyltransferase
MDKQIKRNKLSAEYYDVNFIEYEKYFSDEHLHYGLWYKDTKDHEESLINTVKEVVRLLNIQPDDMVLDAGCGTGGACRYIAETFNVKTYGITMSGELLKAAKNSSIKFLHRELLDISIMDYTTTAFPDGFFTKVFTIESVCHAEKKINFLKEMRRVLSDNGVLVMAEYLRINKRLTIEDKKNYNEWLDGWAMPFISSVTDISKDLKKSNFKIIEVIDVTEYIKKSCDLMFDYAQGKITELVIKKKFKTLNKASQKHLIATARQKYCIDHSLWGYYLIKAVKK